MPATKVQQRVRIDPKARPVEGMAGRMKLQNRDPNKWYVWADEHGLNGVEYYKSLGYEVECLTDDGVRPVLTNTTQRTGDAITSFGMFLMSCPMDWKREMDASEQQAFDATERRIITKRGGIDYLRGIGLTRQLGVRDDEIKIGQEPGSIADL